MDLIYEDSCSLCLLEHFFAILNHLPFPLLNQVQNLHLLLATEYTLGRITIFGTTHPNHDQYHYKGRHGTDQCPTLYCLDIFPTLQLFQNMPFMPTPAFVQSGICLFLSVQLDATGWPHYHGPTNVRAMVKKIEY